MYPPSFFLYCNVYQYGNVNIHTVGLTKHQLNDLRIKGNERKLAISNQKSILDYQTYVYTNPNHQVCNIYVKQE